MTDLCPECPSGNLDLAQSGDGRWGIEWYPVQVRTLQNVIHILNLLLLPCAEHLTLCRAVQCGLIYLLLQLPGI